MSLDMKEGFEETGYHVYQVKQVKAGEVSH